MATKQNRDTSKTTAKETAAEKRARLIRLMAEHENCDEKTAASFLDAFQLEQKEAKAKAKADGFFNKRIPLEGRAKGASTKKVTPPKLVKTSEKTTKAKPVEAKKTLQDRVQAIAETPKAKAVANKKLPVKPKPQLQLDLWPATARGVPNSLLRGALFGVSRDRKVYKKRTLVASLNGYEVRRQGITFNQTDLDTFEGMLHLAMPHPLGTRVEFTVHSFLKSQGRGTGNSQHEQFKEELARLIGGVVEVTFTKEQKTFIGSLISKAWRDDVTGRYIIVFNDDMLKLYKDGYTLIDWEQRQTLGNNNLAKWLHGFYATHAKPYAYRVVTLHELSGSTTAELFKFRQQLKEALDTLVSIGAINSWELIDDAVHVSKTPTLSQRKHLIGKGRK